MKFQLANLILLSTLTITFITAEARQKWNVENCKIHEWYSQFEANQLAKTVLREQNYNNEDNKTAVKQLSTSSGRRLSRLVAGKTFFTTRRLEQATNYLLHDEDDQEVHSGESIKSITYLCLNAKLHSQAWNDMYLHKYDTFKDMRKAAGPQVNQELCLRQLEHLAERTEANLRAGLDSRDTNYLRYISTFGRAPSTMLQGNLFWVGSHDQCKRVQLNLPDNERTGSRYCVASFTLKGWSDSDPLREFNALKTGVCLPESCDSANYKNKFELIARIAEFNARPIDLNTTEMLDVYCLPDEQSELRTWWKSTPTLLTVCCASLWMLMLAFATYKDERNRRQKKQEEQRQLVKTAGKIGLSNGFKATAANSAALQAVYRSLSITSNLRSLFSTGKSSLLEQQGKNETETAPTNENDPEKQQAQKAAAPARQIVNLDVIEGIKVLAAIYIISGHVLMISTQLSNNGRELATSTSIVYTLSNLMPAFAVNAFFAITGILTSYLMFKQNQSHSFITSPLKWVAFILYRYLRIMPMYALVTLFCKHVARFTGDGPQWDYGTSSLAARRICEQESWAWTLLFGANFKSPIKHCVPSAWYLANDFQFFIVTPIFLAALHKRPKLGKALILASIAVSFAATNWSIFQSPLDDVRPIANFMPHAFMVYVNFLHETYSRPLYRVPAYLVGLLLGCFLFEYELKKRAHLEAKESRASHEDLIVEEAAPEPEWPARFRRWGPWFSFVVGVLVIATPSVSVRLNFDGGLIVRTVFSLYMPAFHILYALAVGVYVLLSTTGHGNSTIDSFLSHKFWKPLARLSLCVVLINVEVIAHIVQSSRDSKYLDNQYLASLNLYAVVWTYIMATIVCVLFEAPVRAAVNYLLAFVMANVKARAKATKMKSQ